MGDRHNNNFYRQPIATTTFGIVAKRPSRLGLEELCRHPTRYLESCDKRIFALGNLANRNFTPRALAFMSIAAAVVVIKRGRKK